MKRLALFFIHCYRRYVSPMLTPSCRFVPTCSEYAEEAFRTQSAPRALWLTVVRILKCHPFHPGGYDPVK